MTKSRLSRFRKKHIGAWENERSLVGGYASTFLFFSLDSREPGDLASG